MRIKDTLFYQILELIGDFIGFVIFFTIMYFIFLLCLYTT